MPVLTARGLRLGAIALMATAMTALAGCTAEPMAVPVQVPVDAFQIDVATPLASLDPANACSIEDLGLLSDAFPTLVKHKVADGDSNAQRLSPHEVVPDLATEWWISEDQRTYTFRLVEGAVFPSGNPIDASVVKWSWERTLASGGCGTSFVSGGDPDLVQSIEALDPTTVEVKLRHPSSDYLLALASAGAAVIDRGLVVSSEPDEALQGAWISEHFSGGAAYTIEEYQAGTSMRLKANPAYWGEAPIEESVQISFITDDAKLLKRAHEGKADITLGLTKQSVRALEFGGNVTVFSSQAAAWQLVALPNQMAPFDNAKFREALAYATPQQELVASVAQGYGEAFYGPFAPAFPAYNPGLSMPRAFDLAKAKKLVAESGVSVPVELDIYIREGVNDQRRIAAILATNWREVGVNLKISALPAAEYQAAVSAEKKSYGIIRFDGPSVVTPGWLASYDLACGQVFNLSNYCDPKVDELVSRGRSAASEDARQEAWDAITERWVAESPRVIAYAEDYTAVLSNDVTDFVWGQNNLEISKWGTR